MEPEIYFASNLVKSHMFIKFLILKVELRLVGIYFFYLVILSLSCFSGQGLFTPGPQDYAWIRLRTFFIPATTFLRGVFYFFFNPEDPDDSDDFFPGELLRLTRRDLEDLLELRLRLNADGISFFSLHFLVILSLSCPSGQG